MSELDIPELFPCFLCGDFKEIFLDKNEKPYFVCNSCGIQSFIRGAEGIRRLERLNSDPEFNRQILEENILNNAELLRIRERIDLLNEKLIDLEPGLFNSDNNKRIRTTLKTNIANLEARFLEIIKK